MKNNHIFCIGLLILSVAFPYTLQAQTAAPKIVVEDCDGMSHDLYAKLDEGKVIVIGWTMPCATCAAPLLSTHNAVLNFAISHPNTVEYWLADDFSDLNCSSVKNWAQNNGINATYYFSTSALSMFDFGSIGMPKVVVIGCNNGKVYYNVDNTPNGSGVTNAIDNALTDINNSECNTAHINEIDGYLPFKIFPNPAKTQISIVFAPNEYDMITRIKIINTMGQVVFQVLNPQGDIYSSPFYITIADLPEGIYYLNVESMKGVFNQSFIKTVNE